MYGKKMEKERNAREKRIKDITKIKTVEIVVTNHVEQYKQKLTLPHKKLTILYFEHSSSHCAIIIIL